VEIHRPEGVRLQKVLACAGLGSRRHCETLIEAGRVRVDGVVIDSQGVRVDPENSAIEVDGKRIHCGEGRVTAVLHKPAGVVSTMKDERGRPDLSSFVQELGSRVFHVGRLDAETTGVLILTNDGELAHRLAHPTFGIEKTYVAKVKGQVASSLCTVLKAGVDLDDGPVRVTRCNIRDTTSEQSVVEVSLHEGRNRIVRRMFDAVGHPVQELARVQFGPLTLEGLAPGELRTLDPEETGSLLTIAGL